MQQDLISVVVPIYNAQKYIDRCIESVIKQTYCNLELILIDDGSTDESGNICDRWAEKDKRIRVLHKENAGQGIARNDGIKMSQGKAICFIDADDYIKPDTLEHAYSLMLKDSSDIVVFGLDNIAKNGQTRLTVIPTPRKTLYDGDEVLTSFLPDLIGIDQKSGYTANIYMSVWVCLFSTELIKRADWHFVSEREIYSEDTYSLLILYKHINRVSVLCEALYCYCDNDTSYSRVHKTDRFLQIKEYYRQCIDKCAELEYSEEVISRISGLCVSFTISALKQIVAVLDMKKAIGEIRRIATDDAFKLFISKERTMYEKKARKILFFVIRNKSYLLCWMLLKLKL